MFFNIVFDLNSACFITKQSVLFFCNFILVFDVYICNQLVT